MLSLRRSYNLPSIREKGPGNIRTDMPFRYRNPVTIKNKTWDDLSNYQVLVELSSSNFDFDLAQSDGSDIRFTDSDGNLLGYWIESWDKASESASVWVKVPSIPASPDKTEIFMYYGNPSVSSASDGDATFEFFDDFEGTSLDTEKWDEDAVNDITHEVNGYFRFKDATKSGNTYWVYDNTDTGSQHQAKWTLISSFVLEYRSKISDTAASQMGEGGIALVGADNRISANIMHVDGSGNAIDPVLGYIFVEGTTGSSVSVSDGDERDIRYVVNGSNVKIYQKPTSSGSWTLAVEGTSSDIAKIALVAGAFGGYPYLNYIEITNVRIRKYVSPEPTISIGTIEEV